VLAAKLWLIAFAGEAGSGKSTLSRALGRHLQWPVIDKDDVRDLLDDNAPGLAYDVMWNVARRQLLLGMSVICDSPLTGGPWHAAQIAMETIENIGNLVCPAEFKVGEDSRVMVSSVTEGEDKPLKYPLMFRSAGLVLVNKVDLLPHLDFDLSQFLRNLDAVNPSVPRTLLSARTGEGIAEWCDWLLARK
jgi:hydrogenase nickel incorporation protein HypB